MSESRSAVVAGINGFIGAAVARCLRAAGWRVVGLLRAGRSWDRLAEIAGLELLEVETYAVENLRRRLANVQADVIVNLAAAGVAPGGNTFGELLEGNAALVANLLEAVAPLGVRRFLHVGSYSEYAPGRPGALMDEAWPQQPASIYGVAKLTATHLARVAAQRWGVALTVLRLFSVYGPGEAPHRLLPALLRGLTDGKGIDLTPGLQQRDWLYIDDVAEALLAATISDDLGAAGDIYNVCTGQATSVRDVGEWTRELAKGEPRLLRWGALPARPEEPLWVAGDNRRFRDATGWEPRWGWRDGVRATVEASLSAKALAA